MTALTTRDALARALTEALDWNWSRAPGVPSAVDVCRDVADALLASGAVIDAATLADDDRLVHEVTQGVTEMRLEDLPLEEVLARRSSVKAGLRALAAALTERGAQ